jgi:hypothetical protein
VLELADGIESLTREIASLAEMLEVGDTHETLGRSLATSAAHTRVRTPWRHSRASHTCASHLSVRTPTCTLVCAFAPNPWRFAC